MSETPDPTDTCTIEVAQLMLSIAADLRRLDDLAQAPGVPPISTWDLA